MTARAGIAQLVLWLCYRPHNLGFEFRQRHAIFLLSKTSRMTMRPTHPVQWVTGGKLDRGVKLITCLHLLPRLGMSGAIPLLLLNLPLWHEQGQLYLFICENLKTHSLIRTNIWNTAIKSVIPLTFGMYIIRHKVTTPQAMQGLWKRTFRLTDNTSRTEEHYIFCKILFIWCYLRTLYPSNI